MSEYNENQQSDSIPLLLEQDTHDDSIPTVSAARTDAREVGQQGGQWRFAAQITGLLAG